jgi:ParB-like chromosome segregation protein Spo0J
MQPQMQVQRVPLDTLVPDPQNPRTHDERNLGAIANSLRAHGQVEPLLVQASTRIIIAGNGRALAMRSLGWEHCDAVLLDVDDEQRRALALRLNRTAELAGWDSSVLADLAVFDESLLSGLFTDDELGSLLDDLDTGAQLPELAEMPALQVAPPAPAKPAPGKPTHQLRGAGGGSFQGERPTLAFLTSGIKKFEMMVPAEDYAGVMATIEAIKGHTGAQNNTAAILHALREWQPEREP